MDFKIAVLAGDGIGPEISVQGVDVMSAVCEKFGHKVSYEYAICGADAIDKVGDPFPEETYEVCKNADAVLFSAVGDPKFDNDPTAKVRPEQGLLAHTASLLVVDPRGLSCTDTRFAMYKQTNLSYIAGERTGIRKLNCKTMDYLQRVCLPVVPLLADTAAMVSTACQLIR